MRACKQPTTWRALRTELRTLGARPCRVTGSHETWRFEDGVVFVVVRNHLAGTVPEGILATFRRLRQRRCAVRDEDPLPHKLTRANGLRQLMCFERVEQCQKETVAEKAEQKVDRAVTMEAARRVILETEEIGRAQRVTHQVGVVAMLLPNS